MDNEKAFPGALMKVGHVRVLSQFSALTGETLRRLDCVLLPSENQITVTVPEGPGKLEEALNVMRAEIEKRGVPLSDVLAPMGNTFGMKVEYLPL